MFLPGSTTRGPSVLAGALLLPPLRWLCPTTSFGRFAVRDIRGGFSLWLWLATVLDLLGALRAAADRGQRRRDPAEGGGQDRRRATGGRGRRAGSIRPSTADTSSPPTRRDRRAASATRTAAPTGPPTAARSLPPHGPQRPTAGSPPPSSTPTAPALYRGHPRPDAACLVGSADQHPVAWCQSCGPRATDQAAEVIGRVGSAVMQRLERAHTFADREPITLLPTVGRDLGRRRSAQRFLVVPW
jgi:hypothetical protein